MILPFCFDDDFFDSPYLHDETLYIVHDSLLEFWRNHGVLIISNDRSIKFYFDKIKEFPVVFQQDWKNAFTSFLKYNLEGNSISKFLNTKNDYHTFLNYKDIFSIGLTNMDNYSLILNYDNYDENALVQIRALENYTKSKLVKNIKDMSRIYVDENSNIIDVWDERFMVLCKYTSDIKIIDRYFYKTLMQDSTLKDTHFKNFLKLLSSNSVGKVNFTIFSDGGKADSDDRFEIVRYFESNILSSPPLRSILGSLTLYSNSKDFFQPKSHDRYIAFDKHLVQVGTGFEMFRKYPISRTACVLNNYIDSKINTVIKEASSEKIWKEVLL